MPSHNIFGDVVSLRVPFLKGGGVRASVVFCRSSSIFVAKFAFTITENRGMLEDVAVSMLTNR